jgi:hypothetical protein
LCIDGARGAGDGDGLCVAADTNSPSKNWLEKLASHPLSLALVPTPSLYSYHVINRWTN